MEDKIKEFFCRLMICGEGNENEKELRLIDALDFLLSRVEAREPLDEERLCYARFKVSRVPCFSEKYADMVGFLESYQREQL